MYGIVRQRILELQDIVGKGKESMRVILLDLEDKLSVEE